MASLKKMSRVASLLLAGTTLFSWGAQEAQPRQRPPLPGQKETMPPTVLSANAETDPLKLSLGNHLYSLTWHISSMLDSLKHLSVRLIHTDDIYAYLLRYSDIIALLPSLCAQTQDYFTRPVTLSLGVYHDPEIEDSYLLLNVRQVDYDDRFLEELQVCGIGVAESLTDCSGWMVVTSDFEAA